MAILWQWHTVPIMSCILARQISLFGPRFKKNLFILPYQLFFCSQNSKLLRTIEGLKSDLSHDLFKAQHMTNHQHMLRLSNYRGPAESYYVPASSGFAVPTNEPKPRFSNRPPSARPPSRRPSTAPAARDALLCMDYGWSKEVSESPSVHIQRPFSSRPERLLRAPAPDSSKSSVRGASMRSQKFDNLALSSDASTRANMTSTKSASSGCSHPGILSPAASTGGAPLSPAAITGGAPAPLSPAASTGGAPFSPAASTGGAAICVADASDDACDLVPESGFGFEMGGDPVDKPADSEDSLDSFSSMDDVRKSASEGGFAGSSASPMKESGSSDLSMVMLPDADDEDDDDLPPDLPSNLDEEDEDDTASGPGPVSESVVYHKTAFRQPSFAYSQLPRSSHSGASKMLKG